MSELSQEYKRNFLLNAGIVVEDCIEEYEKLINLLHNKLLTAERKDWFYKNYEKYMTQSIENIKKRGFDTSRYVNNRENWCLWDIFAFNLLSASKNEEALLQFTQKKINRCYMININKCAFNNVAYTLQGKYNTAYIIDEYDFELLKNDIREFVEIPAWVVDSIAAQVGGDSYIFDDGLDWLLICTHEKTYYFCDKL